MTKNFIVGMVTWLSPAIAMAQAPPVHYQYGLELPPGAIGRIQVGNRAKLACSMQPVEVRVPDGALISIAMDGSFVDPYASRLTASVQVGQVYRFGVTQIPKHAAEALYPTIELIDRLHPPPGLASHYPIRIVLPQEDLELALQGKLVTRVIYLEDPRNPFPFLQRHKDQRYFDVLPGENPIQVADELGRPMAIVRIGSRTPETASPDDAFLFGSPPVSLYESIEPIEEQPLAPIVDAVPRTIQPERNLEGMPETPAVRPDEQSPPGAAEDPSPLDLLPRDAEPTLPEAGVDVTPDGVPEEPDDFDFEGIDEL